MDRSLSSGSLTHRIPRLFRHRTQQSSHCIIRPSGRIHDNVARWKYTGLGHIRGATFLFTLTAVIFQLGAFKIMFEIVTRNDFGVDVNPDFSAFFYVFLISLPLVALAVALQIIVATVSRSYKETQTYLGLLPLIPSLPGMILVFIPLKAQIWMMSVPTFAQVLLIGKLMRDEGVSVLETFVAFGATSAVAALLFVFAGRLYERDNLLFGG